MSLTNFWIPCILMGFGISLDVAIATIARFHDKELSLKTWTIPITRNHVIFPAIGYYVFWGLSESLPTFRPLLGIIGFIFVFLFIYETLCDSINSKPVSGISSSLSRFFGLSQDSSRRSIIILAVSWDAIWSGPAKSAAAVDWTSTEVFWSFFVAGMAVALVAQVSLFTAFQLRKINFHNAYTMAKFNFWGKYLELSIIGGFGVLSLWHGLTGTGNIYDSTVISFTFLGLVFLSFRKKLIAHELSEAKIAIE